MLPLSLFFFSFDINLDFNRFFIDYYYSSLHSCIVCLFFFFFSIGPCSMCLMSSSLILFDIAYSFAICIDYSLLSSFFFFFFFSSPRFSPFVIVVRFNYYFFIFHSLIATTEEVDNCSLICAMFRR